jgi:hypothetical protein
MGEIIDTITYSTLWAGVAWGIFSMIRVVVLSVLGLRP